MKKTLQSIIVLSLLLCGASAYAQPNYLAGSSKFDGLSSAVPSGSNITVEMRSSGNVGSKTVSANANATVADYINAINNMQTQIRAKYELLNL